MFEDLFGHKKYYKVSYPNVKELAQQLIPRIESFIPNNHCDFMYMKDGGKCSYPSDLINVHWADILDDLNNFIVEHTKIYCNEIGYYKGKDPYVKTQWFTYYPKTAYFDFHRHAGVIVTAVLYVKKEDNGGNLLLLNNKNNRENGIIEQTEISVEQGDLLFFPGYLNHKSQPNLNDNIRITISTDIDFKR